MKWLSKCVQELRVFLWPHNRLASPVCIVELLVPVGQQSIALTDSIPDDSSVLRAKQPRLTSGGVQVGMCTKERLVGASLVPTHQQLSTGGLKEASNISYGKGKKRKCNWGFLIQSLLLSQQNIMKTAESFVAFLWDWAVIITVAPTLKIGTFIEGKEGKKKKKI